MRNGSRLGTLALIALSVLSVLVLTPTAPVRGEAVCCGGDGGLTGVPLPDPAGPTVTYSDPGSYDTLVAWWQALAVQYPNFVSLLKANEYYGMGQVPSSTAHPDYDLWIVLVTNHSLPLSRPEVFFMGNPHGDEQTGPIGAYWAVHWWLRYALTTSYESPVDPWLNYLLDHREVYFMISQNPDGFDRNRRGDYLTRDLNREADHDGPEAGSGWSDVFESVNGRTVAAFMDDHQVLAGMDFHGGIRALLYPWGSTRAGVTAVSPVTGRVWPYAPPDFYLYDVFSHRMGNFIGDFGGNYGTTNVGTPPGIVGYAPAGTYLDWAYGGDDATNPLESSFVKYGPYPGASALWITPEISAVKHPSSGWGTDTQLGWGIDVRRMLFAMIDYAEPYVSWHPTGVVQDAVVEQGATVSVRWQVNGSLVVDATQLFWGTDPDPVSNYTTAEPERADFSGYWSGGTGWDGAMDGNLVGYVWSNDWVAPAPGDYYFVARAKVDQAYNATLNQPAYGGADTYLRLVKQRAWDGWTETRNSSTDGAQSLAGRDWWYSPVLHIQVVADTTPPFVTLLDPANNSLIQPGTILKFAVQDAHPYTLTRSLDGLAWTPMGLLLSTSTWADGPHVLAVNATDTEGNTATYAFQFDVDGTPPAVTLLSPGDGAVIAPGATLDFDASDAHLLAVNWTEGAGTIPLAAPYDIDTTGWADSLHAVTVTATDAAGNTASLAATFTVDSQAPLIQLVNPPDGAIIPSGTLIEVAVTDPSLASTTLDTGSGPQPVTPPISINTLGWIDGPRTISVTAADVLGHTAVASFSFTLDSTPPGITAPATLPYFAAGRTLDFAVSDANLGAAFWSLGGPEQALAAPYDIDTAGWPDGTLVLTVRAVDLAGNEATAALSFTIDSTPPTVGLAGASPQRSTGSVQATVADANLDAVTYAVTNATAGGTLPAPYALALSGWGEGVHLATVTATDVAGNTATASLSVAIDDTPPVIQVTPSGGLLPLGAPIVLAAKDPYLASAGYRVDLGPELLFTATTDVDPSGWSDGSRELAVTATDLAGNTATVTAIFEMDRTKPQIEFEAPDAIEGSVTVIASVTDANAVAVAFSFSVDNGSWTDVNGTAGPDGMFSASLGELAANGVVRVRVTAIDAAGNSETPPTQTFTVRPMTRPPQASSPLPVVLALLLLAFVALFLLLLLRRRRRDPNRQIEG